VIGRLHAKKVKIDSLIVDDLTVKRLRILTED
jgi:hypothetical protein